jgi:Tfp pilus assembly protein PilO
MNKLDTFLSKHGSKIIIALLVLTYFKSCGIDSEVEKVKKELRQVEAEVDTLASQVINEAEMIKLINEVPAWKTLRIEEISDKERISINALEENEN